MPLVLVQNEVTIGGKYDHWEDNEGVEYHFPNKYINKVREGELFVYYRGARRLNNRRGIPEYFGFGRIGRISPDPQTDFTKARKDLRWYCEILDYIPFSTPVPFKIAGVPFEKISDNSWRDGVRDLSEEVFHAVLEKASIPTIDNEPIVTSRSRIIPNVSDVQPLIVTGKEQLLTPTISKSNERQQGQSGGPKSNRYSKYSKLYGDHSEEVVYNVLLRNRSYKLRWVAQQKEKPGWDIEYYDDDNLIAVEVKATSGKRFLNVEITAGEWNAAEKKGPHYNLYLVADCLGTYPRIQVINNPYSMYLNKQLSLDPIVYRLRMNA